MLTFNIQPHTQSEKEIKKRYNDPCRWRWRKKKQIMTWLFQDRISENNMFDK